MNLIVVFVVQLLIFEVYLLCACCQVEYYSHALLYLKKKELKDQKKIKKGAKFSHNILTNLEVKLTVFYHIITPTYKRCLNAPRDV